MNSREEIIKLVENKIMSPNKEDTNRIFFYLKEHPDDIEIKRNFALCNNRLVKKNASKFHAPSMTTEDLEQEGFMGLLTAIDKFNVDLGYAFSTYAVFWIQQAIRRAIINKGYSVRVPNNVQDSLTKISQFITTYEKENLGDSPNKQTIAKELNLPINKVKNYLFLMNTRDLASLDKTFQSTDGIEFTFYETLPNAEELTEEKAINSLFFKNFHNDLEEILDERELFIITAHYGLNGERSITLQEIAEMLKISRQAVNRKEQRILKKLRENKTILNYKQEGEYSWIQERI